MGSWPLVEESSFCPIPGLRLGRRSATCENRTRLVPERFYQCARGGALWGSMLVARADELGKLAAEGAYPTPQLVAGCVLCRLRALGRAAGSESPGLFDQLPDCPRGFERTNRVRLEEGSQ